MSNVINVIECLETFKNTGTCDCFFDPKEVVAVLLAPRSKRFTESELADANIAAAMADALIAVSDDRIRPLSNIVGITDSSEEPVMQTFGYGKSENVREGIYSWVLNYRKGGVNLNNALRSYNGHAASMGVFLIMADNTLVGTLVKNAGANEIAPIPLDDLYTFPWKVNDGSKLAEFRTKIVFEPIYINDLIAIAKVPPTVLLLKQLEGLKDVTLVSGAAATSTTCTVKLATDCGDSVYEAFKSELAGVTTSQPDCFVLKNKATGAAFNVTSIAANDTLKAFVFTIPTSGNANYPSASGVYTVELRDAETLADKGVIGYEGVNALEVTRPS